MVWKHFQATLSFLFKTGILQMNHAAFTGQLLYFACDTSKGFGDFSSTLSTYNRRVF